MEDNQIPVILTVSEKLSFLQYPFDDKKNSGLSFWRETFALHFNQVHITDSNLSLEKSE